MAGGLVMGGTVAGGNVGTVGSDGSVGVVAGATLTPVEGRGVFTGLVALCCEDAPHAPASTAVTVKAAIRYAPGLAALPRAITPLLHDRDLGVGSDTASYMTMSTRN